MICRVCLKQGNNPIKIFDANGLQLQIAHILQLHFWFKPNPNDEISTVVCSDCWLRVRDFHEFYLAVEQAHQAFALCVKEEEVEELHSSTSTSTNANASEVTIKQEVVENIWHEHIDVGAEGALVPADHEQSDEGPETVATTNPLYEPEMTERMVVEVEPTSLELEDNASKLCDNKQDTDSMDTDDSDSNKESKLLAMALKSAKSTARKTCIRKDRKLDRARTAKSNERTRPASSRVEIKPPQPKVKRIMRQWITPQDDEIVKKHIPMGCERCHFVGDNFAEIRQHFREQHQEVKRPFVVCCGLKLSKHALLVQHAQKHEDPEFFKCTECQKVLSNGYLLRAHIGANHAPDEELTYACDLCPKRFARRHLLDLHKPSHVPADEWQYFCDKCPQSKFASEHLLQIHISMRHRKAVNVCHVCAKEIRSNKSFEKHVRLHFEDSGPRIKCPRPGCESWLKDKDNLRQHLRRHNDEGKLFICVECGKNCKNRASLNSHTNYAHSKEIFECDQCCKTFKRAITLREHMTQHTGETLYKCPFCTRTFNSNANMHSHKKKMHPIEWDKWRKAKSGSSQTLVANTAVL